MTQPTPHEAAELLDRIDAEARRNTVSDAWPLVLLYMTFGALASTALVALAWLVPSTQVEVLQAAGREPSLILLLALAWLLPLFAVYFPYARSWRKGSTLRFALTFGITLGGLLLGAALHSVTGGTLHLWIFAAVIWVLCPLMSLAELRSK